MTLLGSVLLIGLLSISSTIALPKGESVQLTAEKEGFIRPIWSPDGRSIAMTRGDWAGIWRIHPDGTQLQELTADAGAGYQFAWSPDGTKIAYRAEKMVKGKRHFAIKVIDVDTKVIADITDYQRYLGPPRWVWDDGTLVYEIDRQGRLAQAQGGDLIPHGTDSKPVDVVASACKDLKIWVSKPDGHEKTLISGPNERCFDPILSPVGDRVCYSVLSDGGGIAVATRDGTQRLSLGYGSNPCWSPDGQSLVYEVTEDDGMVITASDLYLIRADGSAREQLTDTPDLIERWPNWSPDGATIAFSAGGAIYVVTIKPATTTGE